MGILTAVSCCCCCLLINVVVLIVDETRVILTKIPGIEGSDYINANYIDVR